MDPFPDEASSSGTRVMRRIQKRDTTALSSEVALPSPVKSRCQRGSKTKALAELVHPPKRIRISADTNDDTINNVDVNHSTAIAGTAMSSVVSQDGWHSLWTASFNGHLDALKSLIEAGADVNQTYKDNTTPLYVASEKGYHDVVQTLLGAGADVNMIRSYDGKSTLMTALENGHLDIVKALIEAGANVNYIDMDGNTPLHHAAGEGHTACVKYLLSTPGIAVNAKNKRQQTPLMVATKYDVITSLQKYSTCYEDYPVHTFNKVILCGDTGAGKSTLAKAIIESSQSAGRIGYVKTKLNLDEVATPLTAGIVAYQVQNSKSNMMLYDFAGHHSYYSSHSSLLEAISLTSPSTFLMLVNVTVGSNGITAQMYYWSAMICNVCHKCPQPSFVIVVGTHADKVKKGYLTDLGAQIEKLANVMFEKHNFVQFIALNVKKYGNDLKIFLDLLDGVNENVLKMSPAISLSSHLMYAFLNDMVPSDKEAISLSGLLSLIENDKPRVLPTETSEIIALLTTLADKGFIIFHHTDGEDSWIVRDLKTLLEKVNGALFAPSSFKEYLPIASNTGIIPLNVLKSHFPNHNTAMIVQFLIQLQLCQRINLIDVNTNMAPTIPSPSDLLFFPSLIHEDRPHFNWSDFTTLPSINGEGAIAEGCFGWLLYADNICQFFPNRFLHTLLLNLAYNICLSDTNQEINADIQNNNRQCKVWSTGISWRSVKGVSTIIELMEHSRCLFLVMAFPHQKFCNQLAPVLQTIKSALSHFCPFIAATEYIVDPSTASSVFLQGYSPLSLTRVQLSYLSDALKDDDPTVVDTNNKVVVIKNWTSVGLDLPCLVSIAVNDVLSKLSSILDGYKTITFEKLKIAKLVFYGTPRTGKTTLRKKLLGTECITPEPSTHIAETCDPVFVERVVMTGDQGSQWKWTVQGLDDIANTLLECLDNKLLHGPPPNRQVDINKKYPFEKNVIKGQTILSISNTHHRNDPATCVVPLPEGWTKVIKEDGTIMTLPPIGPSQLSMQSDVNIDIKQLFLNAVKTGKWSEVVSALNILDQAMLIQIIDGGGQPSFQEIFPLLISGPSVTLLMFKLTDDLLESNPVHYQPSDRDEVEHKWQDTYVVRDCISHALSSLISLQPDSVMSKPNDQSHTDVLLVGTHRDQLKGSEDEKKEKILKCAQSLLGWLRQSNALRLISAHSIEDFVTDISNFNPKDIIRIKKKIENLISQRKPKKIPAPWLVFDFSLHKYAKTHQMRKVDKMVYQKIAELCGIKDDEIGALLHYLHHEAGTLLHYPDIPELQHCVITDYQLIFDSVSKVIIQYFDKSTNFSGVELFHKKGQFEDTVLQNIDCCLSVSELLALLQHRHIVSKMEENSFFMPSVLPKTKVEPSSADSSSFLVMFEHGYCPVGLFCAATTRLIVAHKWEVNTSEQYRNKISFVCSMSGNWYRIVFTAFSVYYEVKLVDKDIPSQIKPEIYKAINAVFGKICKDLKIQPPVYGFYCPGACTYDGSTYPQYQHPAKCSEAQQMKCFYTDTISKLTDEHKMWFQKEQFQESLSIEQANPTLKQLLYFIGKTRTFNVAALVGTAYTKMGVFLLNDETGTAVQALENEHMRDAEKINMAIFIQWLQGKGAQPVAWSTLIGVLRKIDLCVLADDIEGGLK